MPELVGFVISYDYNEQSDITALSNIIVSLIKTKVFFYLLIVSMLCYLHTYFVLLVVDMQNLDIIPQ